MTPGQTSLTMDTRSIYFIGIGGTAMASVAVALASKGYHISGSDMKLYPPMSDFLAAHRIAVHEGFNPATLLACEPDMVVVGNAVSRGNPELEEALNRHMRLVTMPDVVREQLIGDATSIVITGTHGKTTTTSLAAWLFEHAGLHPGFLIGGIAENFNTGCRPNSNEHGGYFITEGDEYDTAFSDKRSKFLLYRPDIAVINNIEFDHADIFDSLASIQRSFRQMVNLIPSNGLLLCNSDDQNALDAASNAFCRVERFGMSNEAEWSAGDIVTESDGMSFTLLTNSKPAYRMKVPLFGEHNLRNTLAAIAVARHAGITIELIAEALMLFRGPKRRMEIIGESQNGALLIDDFAHHPTAVRATLRAMKERYPQRRILACFEPRSNTSTRSIFQVEYANAFNDADKVVIGAVHRAERYGTKEALDTRQLARDLQKRGTEAWAAGTGQAPYPDDIATWIGQTLQPLDVVILLSNGDFSGLKTILTQTFPKKDE